jgi:hypothetical protein
MSLARLIELSSIAEATTTGTSGPAGTAAAPTPKLRPGERRVTVKPKSSRDPKSAQAGTVEREDATTYTIKYDTGQRKRVMRNQVDVGDLNEEVLAEAKAEYDNPSDFAEDLSSVGTALLDLKKIIRSPRWKAWMTATDTNNSSSCAALATDLADSLTALDKAYDALEDELQSTE